MSILRSSVDFYIPKLTFICTATKKDHYFFNELFLYVVDVYINKTL